MAINRWTEAETKRSLYLYFQLPFGQLHSGNPEIVVLAHALGRTPSSIAMKLANFASLDPKIIESGRKGLVGATALDRQVWAEFNSDWTRLVADAEALAFLDLPDSNTVKEDIVGFVHKPFSGPTSMTAVVEQRIGRKLLSPGCLSKL